MELKQARLVTDDVERLTEFYESLTGAKPEIFSAGYVEFQQSPCEGLAITSSEVVQAYGEGVLAAQPNRSLVLDFEVQDVDDEYARLKDKVTDWVMPPAIMPWGNKAMIFRDPDGNVINMFVQRPRT
jgi:uncharacterized glyoxalase superfamily protein PhnB